MATRKSSYKAIAGTTFVMLLFGFIVTILKAVEIAVCVAAGAIWGCQFMGHLAVIRYKDWDEME